MSINWVMLTAAGNDFTPLENESKLWTSQPRTALQLQTGKYTSREPCNVSSSAGRIHLTNRRIVYIPDKSTPQLQSFAAPILNLHDTHVTTPFFGPNSWVAAVQLVRDGGIPSTNPLVQLSLTFKDGGAYEFHDKFVALRERVLQAREMARANGGDGGAANVHLEQLPAYDAAGSSAAATSASAGPQQTQSTASRAAPPPPDDDAPPGYDEVQREIVTERLEAFSVGDSKTSRD